MSNKVEHNQKFFEIDRNYYEQHRGSCTTCNRWCEHKSNEWFYYIRPCYVYSINSIWNGDENFDVSPVDFSLPENQKDNNWKVRYSVEYSEIGKKVFGTIQEARKHFNKKYDKDTREVFKQLKKLKENKDDQERKG